MPSKESYFEQIEKEFATAREAMRVGNYGMVRVCARRAAGQALTWFVEHSPRPTWRPDAMTQLQQVIQDTAFSQEARDAAIRLTTKISERFTYPFSADPIADAKIIIHAIEGMIESSTPINNHSKLPND